MPGREAGGPGGVLGSLLVTLLLIPGRLPLRSLGKCDPLSSRPCTSRTSARAATLPA